MTNNTMDQVSSAQVEASVVLQARLPGETAWQDIDQTTYDHAYSNGLEVRKLYTAPSQPTVPAAREFQISNGAIMGIAERYDVSTEATKRWHFRDVVPMVREVLRVAQLPQPLGSLGANEYRNEGYDVICDRRDLFDFIRAAWREGQHQSGDMAEAERWSKATDHATQALNGWATLYHLPHGLAGIVSARPGAGGGAETA